jgi:hypothetical protein
MRTRQENRMQRRRLRRVGLVLAATLAMGTTAGMSGTAFADDHCRNKSSVVCAGGGGGNGGSNNTITGFNVGGSGGGGFTTHSNNLSNNNFCTELGIGGRREEGCQSG